MGTLVKPAAVHCLVLLRWPSGSSPNLHSPVLDEPAQATADGLRWNTTTIAGRSTPDQIVLTVQPL